MLFVSHLAAGQQLPLYSQYLYNKFLINPAHAGSDGFSSINITTREQWVHYSGAPQTYSLSGQMRILKRGYKLQKNIFKETRYRPKTDGKVGLGGYIFSDKNGLVQRTGVQFTYSYHTWVEDYTQLSFGLSLTGYHYIIKANENSFEDPNEPWLNDNLRKGVFVPNADFGVYLLNQYYDIGFSIQQLFGSATKIGEEAYKNLQIFRHYYLFGTYSIPVLVRTEWETSMLLKVSDFGRPQADLGLTYVYDKRFWAGLDYRTGGAIIGHFRARFVPSNVEQISVFLGYAYDYNLNRIHKAVFGTHEITIAVKFGSTLKRFRWIDRY
jgi:type IX secretion system PorP/SprF family membrane protein